MNDYETQSIALLTRIVSLLERRKEPNSKTSQSELDEFKEKIAAKFIVADPRRIDHEGADWWRLGEIEKIVFPAKGIFAQKAVSAVDMKRRKAVGSALRQMKATERKMHGFPQFFLKLIDSEK